MTLHCGQIFQNMPIFVNVPWIKDTLQFSLNIAVYNMCAFFHVTILFLCVGMLLYFLGSM